MLLFTSVVLNAKVKEEKQFVHYVKQDILSLAIRAFHVTLIALAVQDPLLFVLPAYKGNQLLLEIPVLAPLLSVLVAKSVLMIIIALIAFIVQQIHL